MTKKSAVDRASQVEERERLEEQARLGLKALIGRETEERAAEIVGVLLRALASEDEKTRIHAADLLITRALGRPVQPTQDLAPDMPSSLEDLARLTPEQRRELLRALPVDDAPPMPALSKSA